MRSEPPSTLGAVHVSVGAAIAIVTVGAVVVLRGADEPPPRPAPRATPAAPRTDSRAARPARRERRPSAIRWRRSIAVGSPSAGRLIRGVRLPAAGPAFFTWDPVLRRSPNRPWRRWGTDRLVHVLLDVAREYRAAHPRAPLLAIGDLSRPRGGDFGRRFGPIGHASHQNGLDADIYYPRADGRARAPRYASQIDRRLSQELVDRFLAKGAAVIFVGPNTRLTGPPGRVQALANHDNHLHVRLPG
jgi:Penicillin-insensitive murein endopeptidase